MKVLKISEKFTIDDIHRIREYNFKRRKKMTSEEIREEIKKSARECETRINEYRMKNDKA